MLVIEIFFTLHSDCTISGQYNCSVSKAKHDWIFSAALLNGRKHSNFLNYWTIFSLFQPKYSMSLLFDFCVLFMLQTWNCSVWLHYTLCKGQVFRTISGLKHRQKNKAMPYYGPHRYQPENVLFWFPILINSHKNLRGLVPNL